MKNQWFNGAKPGKLALCVRIGTSKTDTVSYEEVGGFFTEVLDSKAPVWVHIQHVKDSAQKYLTISWQRVTWKEENTIHTQQYTPNCVDWAVIEDIVKHKFSDVQELRDALQAKAPVRKTKKVEPVAKVSEEVTVNTTDKTTEETTVETTGYAALTAVPVRMNDGSQIAELHCVPKAPPKPVTAEDVAGFLALLAEA